MARSCAQSQRHQIPRPVPQMQYNKVRRGVGNALRVGESRSPDRRATVAPFTSRLRSLIIWWRTPPIPV